EIYTLSLHDALPILMGDVSGFVERLHAAIDDGVTGFSGLPLVERFLVVCKGLWWVARHAACLEELVTMFFEHETVIIAPQQVEYDLLNAFFIGYGVFGIFDSVVKGIGR